MLPHPLTETRRPPTDPHTSADAGAASEMTASPIIRAHSPSGAVVLNAITACTSSQTAFTPRSNETIFAVRRRLEGNSAKSRRRSSAQPRCRLPTDQWQVEVGQDARLGRTGRGHGVDAVRSRADDAVFRSLAAHLGVEPLD